MLQEIRDLVKKNENHPDGVEGVEIIQQDDWIQDGKYQSQNIYFKYKDRYFAFYHSRSGSPFTYWNYDEDFDLGEVERKEKLVISWIPKHENEKK